MRLIATLGAVLLLVSCNAREKETQPQESKTVVTEQKPAPVPEAEPSNEALEKRAATPARKDPPPPPVRHSAETQQIAAEKNVNPDALVLADFSRRIDEYMKVHKKAAKDSPPIKETHDPAEIQEGQQGLAREIQALRASARPGDIFTPEIRNAFQRLMYPQVVGTTGREVKQELKEDVRESDEGKPKPVPLKVNASYPEGNALPTVPANVLLNLPKLPEELEYRIIGTTLILRDVQANIIIDFALNVIR